MGRSDIQPHGVGSLIIQLNNEWNQYSQTDIDNFTENFNQDITVIDASRTIDSISFPYTEIENDSYIAIPDRIGANYQIKLVDIQFIGAASGNLEYQLYNVTGASQLYLMNTVVGVRSDSIYENIFGSQTTIEHRLWNRSGATADLGGKVTYEIKDTS